MGGLPTITDWINNESVQTPRSIRDGEDDRTPVVVGSLTMLFSYDRRRSTQFIRLTVRDGLVTPLVTGR